MSIITKVAGAARKAGKKGEGMFGGIVDWYKDQWQAAAGKIGAPGSTLRHVGTGALYGATFGGISGAMFHDPDESFIGGGIRGAFRMGMWGAIGGGGMGYYRNNGFAKRSVRKPIKASTTLATNQAPNPIVAP